jgi:uncharacterized protein
MCSLPSQEKQLLLDVARRALVAAVERRESIDGFPEKSIPTEFGGVFVTLHRRGRLRGCIGQIGASLPLERAVAQSAKSAALEDPRFSPVRTEELPEIEIELSVLSVPAEISLDQIEPGKHGLIVSNGYRRGVLLPQVAMQFGWTAQRFLEETCVKAGIDPDSWRQPETCVRGFTAEVFSEEGVRAARAGSEPELPAPAPAKTGYSTST